MLQLSKILKSREEWKYKAIQRGDDIREFRKSQKRYQERIIELKRANGELQEAAKDKKKLPSQQMNSMEETETPTQFVNLSETEQVRALCTLLTISTVVSYRSIPRILELLKLTSPLKLNWNPNFTSIINWTMRLGLGLLKQVQPITKPWVAIIDHSIDIGTKKTMVVLRITVEALSIRGSAVQLQDCQCIGLSISEKVTGETIFPELEKIFAQSGQPVAIIKDADATLNKGVRLYSEKQEKFIPSIDDIGHTIANALKSQFEKTKAYKRFIALVSYGAKCLRQTDLAFITPPKLRSKGRFQSISKLGEWGVRMLEVFAVKGRTPKGSMLERIRNVFPDLIKSRAFIKHFALTNKIACEVMSILKNKGLNKLTYTQCYNLSKKLPRNSKVKKRLQAWLKQTIEVQKQLGGSLPLIVSSDIIESLFGKFKYTITRNPKADMNRSVLLIPTLCGHLDAEMITQSLNQVSCRELETWEKDNIPYTVRKKRLAFFKEEENPKIGNL